MSTTIKTIVLLNKVINVLCQIKQAPISIHFSLFALASVFPSFILCVFTFTPREFSIYNNNNYNYKICIAKYFLIFRLAFIINFKEKEKQKKKPNEEKTIF